MLFFAHQGVHALQIRLRVLYLVKFLQAYKHRLCGIRLCQLAWYQLLNTHTRRARIDHAQFFGRTVRHVHHAIAVKWTTVIDAHNHFFAIGKIGDFGIAWNR